MWRVGFCLLLLGSVFGQTPPEIDGCPVFPYGNIWSMPVDNLPVLADSAAYVTSIGADRSLKADFGSGTWEGGPIGIPFVVVGGEQPRLPVSFRWADESDPGPYAVPLDAPIEGGSRSDGDRHAIALDRDNCILYELYRAFPGDGRWRTDSAAIFDLRSHGLRPAGWTSADAAGLPILPGLVRYEEVAAGEIRHAIRFTAPRTQRAFLWPARHYASDSTDKKLPPMGLRMRLRANFDVSGYSAEMRVILNALKKYGMILADNGSPWFLSGAPDSRWNNEMLRELSRVHGSDFEAVDVSSLRVNVNSGMTPAATAAPAVTSAASYQIGPVSPGEIVSIFGNGIGPAEPAYLQLDESGRVKKSLGGVVVRFSGTAAPLTYVSSTQINAVVPYDVAGRAETRMEIVFSPQGTITADLKTAPAKPAVFAILNQDYSLNTRATPAAKDEVVVLYCTGFGQTDPAGVDGKVATGVYPAPLLPVKVWIDGVEATDIQWARAAPGFVSGLFQVNVRVPAGVASGEVPITVGVGRYLTTPALRLHVR